MPQDLPPWHTVYNQTRRWIDSEAIVANLREMIRRGAARSAQPAAVILASRTLQRGPEKGATAGWDGAKRRKGSKVHIVVNRLGHLLAMHVAPTNDQDRAQVAELAEGV